MIKFKLLDVKRKRAKKRKRKRAKKPPKKPPKTNPSKPLKRLAGKGFKNKKQNARKAYE